MRNNSERSYPEYAKSSFITSSGVFFYAWFLFSGLKFATDSSRERRYRLEKMKTVAKNPVLSMKDFARTTMITKGSNLLYSAIGFGLFVGSTCSILDAVSHAIFKSRVILARLTPCWEMVGIIR